MLATSVLASISSPIVVTTCSRFTFKKKKDNAGGIDVKMQGCYLVPDSHPYEVVQAALGVRQPSSFGQLVAHHLHTKEGGLTNSLLLLLPLLLLLHQDEEGGSLAYLDPQPPRSRGGSLDIAGGSSGECECFSRF